MFCSLWRRTSPCTAAVLRRGLRGARPEVALTLEQRLQMMNPWDAKTHARVDIGFFVPEPISASKAVQRERLKACKDAKRDHALQALARSGKLPLDYEKQQEQWATDEFREHIYLAADHYGIFRDLYEYGYFKPTKYLKVRYPVGDNELAPVHMGNHILPVETRLMPEVNYPAEEGELFTLVMTSLDTHFEAAENEYLHWMLSNIPGNDVSKGTTVCDYMQAFVPKGAGYHRFVFVLYKQTEGKIDLSSEQRKSNTVSLRERTFRTLDFYRAHQDALTPCGLSFFQSKWDDSLVEFFHNTLDMKVPVYEHIPLKPDKMEFKKYPENESFFEYIDLFRDPKEIAEDIYCRRLKKLNPFEDESPGLKYPHAHRVPRDTPSWYKLELAHERSREGKYRHLKRFSLYTQEDDPPYDKYGIKQSGQ